MKHSNIAKIDSKGRILIPIHIRKLMGAEEGTEIVLLPDGENRHAKMLPLVKEKTAKFRMLINDLPGSLAAIANTFAEYDVDIIMSQSRTLTKGKLAEWDLITDVSKCNGNLKELKNNLLASKLIKTIEMVEK